MTSFLVGLALGFAAWPWAATAAHVYKMLRTKRPDWALWKILPALIIIPPVAALDLAWCHVARFWRRTVG